MKRKGNPLAVTWVIDAILAAFAVAMVYGLVLLFSPPAQIFSQPLDPSFSAQPKSSYTKEDRKEIEAQWEQRLEAIESGELSPDLKRKRLHGPLLWICFPMLIFGLFIRKPWVFVAVLVFLSAPIALVGIFLFLEIFIMVAAALASNALARYFKVGSPDQ